MGFCRESNMDEVMHAVFSINPDCAIGLDGFLEDLTNPCWILFAVIYWMLLFSHAQEL